MVGVLCFILGLITDRAIVDVTRPTISETPTSVVGQRPVQAVVDCTMVACVSAEGSGGPIDHKGSFDASVPHMSGPGGYPDAGGYGTYDKYGRLQLYITIY